MKSCDIIFLMVCVLEPSLSQTQSAWTPVQSGTSYRLNRIRTPYENPSLSFTCAATGTILRSGDYGLSWTSLQSGSSSEVFHSMDFPYSDTILIAGYDGVRSVIKKMYFDSLGSPTIVNLPSPTPCSINDMAFRSSSNPEI